MKKGIMSILITAMVITNSMSAFSATVINKDDAAQYSKKNPYAEINVGVTENNNTDDNSYSTGANQYSGGSIKGITAEDNENKFTATTAIKQGNKYTNAWSNYTLTIDDTFNTAADYYDFAAEGIKYDFAIAFNDYSRLAIYYSVLSRDINEVARIYSESRGIITDEVVAGEMFKHAHKEVNYPYGIEKYDYYLRNVDGKLMVIECFYEKENESAPYYIQKIAKLN